MPEATSLDDFSAALGRMVQDRITSGEWRVIGVSSLRANGNLRLAVEDLFGSIEDGAVIVIDAERRKGNEAQDSQQPGTAEPSNP